MDNNKDDYISIKVNGKEQRIHRDDSNTIKNEPISKEEKFPWVLPNESKDEVVKPFKRKKKKQLKKRKSMPVFYLSIAAALIVGTSFGILMLSLFTNSPIISVFSNSGGNHAKVEGLTTSTVTVPSYDVFAVQGGAFTDLKTAEMYVERVQDNGNASVVIEGNNIYYLFIGLSSSEDEASKIADIYKENGQDVYVKKYSLSALPNLKSEDAKKIQKGQYMLIDLLDVLGTVQVQEQIDHEKLNEIKKDMGIIKTESSISKDKYFQSFIKKLDETYEMIGDKEKLSVEEFWGMQQSLLSALQDYESLQMIDK